MSYRTSTTRLPAALREQIDQESGHSPRQRSKQVVNRKAARKQDRQEQKQRKASFFSHPKAVPQVNQKRSADNGPEFEGGPTKKRLRTSKLPSGLPSDGMELGALQTSSYSQRDHSTKKKKVPNASGTKDPPGISKSKSSKSITKNLFRSSCEEDPEDAHIAWLESKLGTVSSNGGRTKSSLFGDGLDDLLDDLDRIVPMNMKRSGTPSEDESETSDEDLLDDLDRIVPMNMKRSGIPSKDESETSEFEGFSAAEGDSSNDGVGSGSNSDGIEDRASNDTAQERKVGDVVSNAAPNSPQSGTRYIPPHLRQRSTDNSEMLAKLSRQLKGLLNRLNEQNVASILESIEQLYRAHRRNDVTSTLTSLIIDGIASHSSLLDNFVLVYASLIASLHKIVGVELAAHFVQCLIASYEHNYCAPRTSKSSALTEGEIKGKECLNLVVLLSELYNFQVISCVLIYDIIRTLLDNLDEFDVELLLKVVRNSGQQLRQDDPSALKDIIHIVQTKMNTKEQSNISSRTRFMIEVLTNLKNNKAKRSAGQDGRLESFDRLKKFLSGLGRKHHILAHEPLRITLEDIHSSETKGKWWLVGSAWGGDPLLDRAQAADQQAATKSQSSYAADALVKLARKQGMNTDVRRSIFVVLMSSDDYVDACDRLAQLNLTEIQQREIIRVILHCLGNERLYNPYYTLVVQQLCQTSHSYKVTLQFCLWDFLRNLGEQNVGGTEIIKNTQDHDHHIAFDVKKMSSTKLLNVARAYAWWLAKGCSSLSILKPVDFTILQPQSIAFFHALFSQLFISTQVTSPAIALDEGAAEHLSGSRIREALEGVFIKATRVPTLSQGLLYFFTTAFRSEGRPTSSAVSETLKWAREVARETLRTGMDAMAPLT